MVNDPIEVMKTTKTFAIVGASANEKSYGFKLVKNLSDLGYQIFPVNPKYQSIYGKQCFKSISDLPLKAENLVFALSPENSFKLIEQLNIDWDCYVWFPPECWNEELKALAQRKGLKYFIDSCPIGTYLKLHHQYQQNKEAK